MMPKYLSAINLNKNEIQNAVVQNLATAPASPSTGQIYTNTTSTATFQYWNGSVWVTPASAPTNADATITVAGTAVAPTIAVAAGGITNTQINASAAIAYSKLNLSSSVVNTDISTSAAIAYSKLNLSGSVINTDISATAAIAYSKLNLASSVVNTDISATAAIAYSKLNLSGSIQNSDISPTAAITYTKIAAPTTAVNMNGQVINSVGTPVLSTDAANKGYVDAAVQGLNAKQSVLVASTGANVSLTTPGTTLDGVTLTSGCRILLKDQTTTSQNGVYIWTGSASTLTRSPDLNTWSEMPTAYMWVESGTTNGDTAWVCTSTVAGTLETTAVTFVKFATSTGSLTATAPISIVSNAVTLSYAARLVNNAGSLDLASGVIATPGQYVLVTVDTYGRITAGTDLLAGTGIVTRTGNNAYSAVTITGTANQITVTNGSGTAGNPTLSFATGARSNLGATGVYSTLGTGTGTTYTVTEVLHGLGSSAASYCDLIAQAYDVSSNPAIQVFADISINTSTGDVTWTFGTSQTLSNLRFTIIGR